MSSKSQTINRYEDTAIIKDLENTFINGINRGFYEYNGTTYGSKDWSFLITSIIDSYLDSNTEKYLRDYSSFNTQKADYIQFLSTLNKIQIGIESFKKNYDVLQSKAIKLNGIDFKIMAILRLQDHFVNELLKEHENVFILQSTQELIDSFKLLNESLNSIETINTCIVLGKYFGYFDLPTGLMYYMVAISNAEAQKRMDILGNVELLLGDLYASRITPIYTQKAIEHYRNSARYFYEYGDTTNELHARLKESYLYGRIYIENSKNNYFSTFNNIGQHIFSDSYDPNKLSSYLVKNNHRDRILDAKNTLITIYLALKQNANDEQANINTHYAELLLGRYFIQKQKWDIAERLCNSAILTVINTDLSNDRLLPPMMDLAWIYANTSRNEQALTIMDKALHLAHKTANHNMISWLTLHKGNIYRYIGRNSEGIETYHLALQYSDSLQLRPIEQERLKSEIYRLLYYSFPHQSDSSTYYWELHQINQNGLVSEINEMNAGEFALADQIFDRNIQNNEKIIAEKEKLINGKDWILKELGLVLQTKNDSVNMLTNRTNFALAQINKLDSIKINLESDILQLGDEKKKISTIFRWTMGFLLPVLLVAVGGFFILQIKRKADKIRTEGELNKAEINRITLENSQRKITIENNRLDAEANFAYHNIQGFLVDLVYCINTNDKRVSALINKSITYFGHALTKSTILDKWVIETELELLAMYNAMEEALNNNVTIVTSIEVDRSRTKCIPDVLPQLLKNSIKYAYTPEQEKLFSISCRLDNDFVFFEVSDNGQMPKDIDSFIRHDRKNKGLHLIKRRIESLCEKNDLFQVDIVPFSFVATNNGTTIKFVIPHETV